MPYDPSSDHLERYAALLVDYALGGGDGIARGDVVLINAPDRAKAFYLELCKAVWRSGGHVLSGYRPSDDGESAVTRAFYEIADDEQLDFFAASYWKGVIDQSDHLLHIMCESDPHALRDVPPAKIMRSRQARRPLQEWQVAKEDAGALTWTIGLYGTEGMAAEAGMGIEEYWEQIIAGCFLDDPDPVGRWREVNAQITAHCEALNALPIERLHVEGEDIDLWLTVGERRRWLGGGGRNVPSFEVFTSPDWRGTEGRIRFSEPLYIYGSLIRGVELEFRDGRVVSSRADENEPLLREMLSADGADRVGEFSMTDARLSRITRFMANTLYDENTGGRFGNTHLAVGRALTPCYDGDASTVSKEEWERLGFNDSVVHTDIVSTTDRTVTATLSDGTQQVIYRDGQFTVS
ncbi:MAG TPA: aminopeptidase [Solirubrobacteraceae bacterium]|nr:aminopeptidase [Solirubrobacteraceae bacterium]